MNSWFGSVIVFSSKTASQNPDLFNELEERCTLLPLNRLTELMAKSSDVAPQRCGSLFAAVDHGQHGNRMVLPQREDAGQIGYIVGLVNATVESTLPSLQIGLVNTREPDPDESEPGLIASAPSATYTSPICAAS